MPGVSEEQVKLAKEVDLLTYLKENEPYELRKSKYGDDYRTATHGSLVISKGLWYWNKGGIGGKTALDFLIKMRGMNFVDAVETVLGTKYIGASHGSASYSASFALPVEKANQASSSLEQSMAKLVLPEKAPFPTRVVSYLQKRGISPEVINRCLSHELLFESRRNQNAVFVGYDELGQARFACQRSTRNDFKADVRGSDKRYSFSLPAESKESRLLTVFESPIDLLSHTTLHQLGALDDGHDWPADTHRLSLGGTSDVALMAYLERNPVIDQIYLCLDADEAGQMAVRKIAAKLAGDDRLGHISVFKRLPQNSAKDYNDVLLRVVEAEHEHKQQMKQSSRRETAI